MKADAQVLGGVIDTLAALAPELPGTRSDADALAWAAHVEHLGRHVDALRVAAAGDLAERSRRELGLGSLARQQGLASAGQLVELVARVSASEAARRIRLARETAPRVSITGEVRPPIFEHVAAALQRGDIGTDAALTITRHLADAAHTASISQLREAEAHLVDAATTACPDLVAVQARAWRVALDPDGAEPRDRALRQRRRFMIGREIDGMTPFWGEADPVSAAQLRAWLGERTSPTRQPRFVDPDDSDDCAVDAGAAGAGAAQSDPRSREQRSFDILMGLLQAGVRSDALVTGPLHAAANVMVIVSQADLMTGRGIARLSDVAEPISAATAGVIACDAGIQPIALDMHGQPLSLGRRQRLFSSAQRKALAVRDGGCAWTFCTAPPSWTHAHHIRPWSERGPTDLDNGVLLCPFHHHLLHEGEFQISMRDSRPHLLAPPRLDPTQTWHPMGTHRTGAIPSATEAARPASSARVGDASAAPRATFSFRARTAHRGRPCHHQRGHHADEGTHRVGEDVTQIAHPIGEEELRDLDPDSQSHAQQHRRPPVATSEQEEEEEPDGYEHHYVHAELEARVVDPRGQLVLPEHPQQRPNEPAVAVVERLRTERHPRHEPEIPEREHAEHGVMAEHPATLTCPASLSAVHTPELTWESRCGDHHAVPPHPTGEVLDL